MTPASTTGRLTPASACPDRGARHDAPCCVPAAVTPLDASRGEPAFVFELAGQTFGFVLEGLGTKSIIARQLEDRLGAAAFAAVAYDTVAAIVNDLSASGPCRSSSTPTSRPAPRTGTRTRPPERRCSPGGAQACERRGRDLGWGRVAVVAGPRRAARRSNLPGAPWESCRAGARPVLGEDLRARRRDRPRRPQRPSRQRFLARPADRDSPARRVRDAAAERPPVRRGAARPRAPSMSI